MYFSLVFLCNAKSHILSNFYVKKIQLVKTCYFVFKGVKGEMGEPGQTGQPGFFGRRGARGPKGIEGDAGEGIFKINLI